MSAVFFPELKLELLIWLCVVNLKKKKGGGGIFFFLLYETTFPFTWGFCLVDRCIQNFERTKH